MAVNWKVLAWKPVRGSRVSLASIIHAFRRGAAPEVILQDFPVAGNLGRIYGAIAFILQNPDVVEGYLAGQERLWNELKGTHPLPPDRAARSICFGIGLREKRFRAATVRERCPDGRATALLKARCK